MLAVVLVGLWVQLGQGYVVDAYPISMRAPDFVLVGVTVLVVGLLASVLPALKASRVSTQSGGSLLLS